MIVIVEFVEPHHLAGFAVEKPLTVTVAIFEGHLH
jgi:hypothetical protein